MTSSHRRESSAPSPGPSVQEAASAGRQEAAKSVVIDRAIEMFVDRGFEAVSVEDIARGAGISVRTFYRYFGSREGVLLAFALRSARFLPEAVARRPAGESAFEALVAAATTWDDATEQDHRTWASIVRGVPEAYRYVEAALWPAFRRMVAAAVEPRLPNEARSRGDADILAAVVVGVLVAVSERALADDLDRRPLMARAFDTLRAASGGEIGDVVATRGS
jgi:AcrR family transcriptional regulator